MSTLTKAKSKYRYSAILLRELVITDFKLRYQSSALGYVWSLLRPLFLFAIMYVVFSYFLKVGDAVPYYPVYLLVGIVLWNYFSEIVNQCISSIVNRGPLIRKINFPKYVIVLSCVISATINFFINFLVIIVFMVILRVPLTANALLAPLFFLELLAFAIGVGFLLSAIYVKLRDIAYIWEIAMQALFYAVPIVYPLSFVADKWVLVAQVMVINPIAHAIQGFRHALVTPETQTLTSLFSENTWINLIPIAIVILTLIISITYFRSQSQKFAENI